ncbi:hypothetical protein [Halorussus lipolyticus]|uniref:hypothetical protein n=1 Tax=Halorussus lipolyticus TaxID=3034024 RepID=UPI0023E7940E|nr:hypothetical protein [Halorussus sp. DT80]
MGALEVVTDDDANWVSWLLVGLLALAVGISVVRSEEVWAVFLVGTLGILLVPPVVFRDSSAMLPPEVTGLALLPAVVELVAPEWVTEYALYLGVAALAFAIVVELSLFTDVEMAPWFADATVVLTTMAAIGSWAIVQFYADQWLGTDFITSRYDLMREFIRGTIAGVLGAGVFELYFQFRTPAETKTPDVTGGEDG